MHVTSPQISPNTLGKATAIEQKLVESLLRAPVTKREISCTLATEFPYAVKDLDKDLDNLVLSPADAVATLLHAWDHQLPEAFFDIDVNPTMLVQQFDEGADGLSRPRLLLEREGMEIKIIYHHTGTKTEYRAQIDEITWQWVPLGAIVVDKTYHANDPIAPLIGQLLTARILHDEPWKTDAATSIHVSYEDLAN